MNHDAAAALTLSAAAGDRRLAPGAEFPVWWAGQRRAGFMEVEQIPFDELDRWHFEQASGDLVHESGRFFAVRGLRARDHTGALRYQPIIDQPEIGILGIIVKEFDGILHCLMQAKTEPGNVNGPQLSPTVQATRSNYTRAHGGRSVRYLEFFTGDQPARVLADVLQPEQGIWFWRKRNRNIVVHVPGDVPLHENFCWLTVHQLRKLLATENVVNMDTRSVLGCLPLACPGRWAQPPADRFMAAVVRSYQPGLASGEPGALHPLAGVLRWLAAAQKRCAVRAELMPLDDIEHWSRTARDLVEQQRRYFRIIATRVAARGREVSAWTQPMLAPSGVGLAAFIVRRIDGVAHVLAQARAEVGSRDVELAPTVTIRPEQDGLPSATEPFVNDVITPDSERIRYDTTLSEEGGRLYHAQTRYRVVDVGEDFPIEVPWNFCWITVQQLMALARGSSYLSVEARSLLTCIHSLW